MTPTLEHPVIRLDNRFLVLDSGWASWVKVVKGIPDDRIIRFDRPATPLRFEQ